MSTPLVDLFAGNILTSHLSLSASTTTETPFSSIADQFRRRDTAQQGVAQFQYDDVS